MICVFILFGWLFGNQKNKQVRAEKEYDAEVRLILVDVIVTKDARFVEDLQKEDFELYEDNRRVPINSFERITFEDQESAAETEIRQSDPEIPSRKKLAVVFDGINSLDLEIRKSIDDIVDD